MPSRFADGFTQWLHTPVGQYIWQQQQVCVKDVLSETAGFRVMELLLSTQHCIKDDAPQMHRFAMAEFPLSDVSAVCDFHNLPLPSDTVELAILNHVLDFCEYPHETLKEASRVLQPSGTLIIVGFNPLSLMGMLRWPFRTFLSGLQWRSRSLSVLRMTDWLKLLGFQCEKVIYGGYIPPVQSKGFIERLSWIEKLATKLHLPLGAFYIIEAKKQRVRPLANGRAEWLAKAIKPVKLRSDVSAKPSSIGPKKHYHTQN